MNIKPTYQPFGESGILINWPAKINPLINDEVLQMDHLISKNFGEQIIEVVPAYHSLAVYLKDGENTADFVKLLENIDLTVNGESDRTKNIFIIPVCYEAVFAPDLEEVANFNGLSAKEAIALHTQGLYKVYFLGFLPGFPYLGGLSEKLYTPRKSKPRKNIEKGSVAIGGEQTGIYTLDSPAGWNIIGRSPLNFFSCENSLQCLLKPGYFVRFKRVSAKNYKKIKTEIEAGNYKVEKEAYCD